MLQTMRKGFTLIEMSLVLVIIGMIIVIVFPALQAIRSNTQYTLTRNNLDYLMRTSAAFTHAHGCVPCPTPAGTTGHGFGHVRGNNSGDMCGDCTIAEGIPPFASLGIPQRMAKDGWGRWFTMRIDPALATNFGPQPPTAACTASDNQATCPLDHSAKGLCAMNISKANTLQIRTPGGTTQEAAILFLSHGANGFSSYRAGPLNIGQANNHPSYDGPSTNCSLFGGFERCNTDGNNVFTDADRNNNTGAPFDDFLYHLKRNALISLLGNHICETVW